MNDPIQLECTTYYYFQRGGEIKFETEIFIFISRDHLPTLKFTTELEENTRDLGLGSWVLELRTVPSKIDKLLMAANCLTFRASRETLYVYSIRTCNDILLK